MGTELIYLILFLLVVISWVIKGTETKKVGHIGELWGEDTLEPETAEGLTAEEEAAFDAYERQLLGIEVDEPFVPLIDDTYVEFPRVFPEEELDTQKDEEISIAPDSKLLTLEELNRPAFSEEEEECEIDERLSLEKLLDSGEWTFEEGEDLSAEEEQAFAVYERSITAVDEEKQTLDQILVAAYEQADTTESKVEEDGLEVAALQEEIVAYMPSYKADMLEEQQQELVENPNEITQAVVFSSEEKSEEPVSSDFWDEKNEKSFWKQKDDFWMAKKDVLGGRDVGGNNE